MKELESALFLFMFLSFIGEKTSFGSKLAIQREEDKRFAFFRKVSYTLRALQFGKFRWNQVEARQSIEKGFVDFVYHLCNIFDKQTNSFIQLPST